VTGNEKRSKKHGVSSEHWITVKIYLKNLGRRNKMRTIGKSWTTKKRKINGKNRTVKVRKIAGKYQVRVKGYRNTADKGKNRKAKSREINNMAKKKKKK